MARIILYIFASSLILVTAAYTVRNVMGLEELTKEHAQTHSHPSRLTTYPTVDKPICTCRTETIKYRNKSYSHPQFIVTNNCVDESCDANTMCIQLPYDITIWSMPERNEIYDAENIPQSCQEVFARGTYSRVTISAACIPVYFGSD